MKIAVDGAVLNVEDEGDERAPAVLLWHGAGCTLRMWDQVVARLRDTWRLIRFDVRGVGNSTPAANPESQYTLEQYAADANAILDHCGVDQCHIWGMAWGSRAALAYCALNAPRVLTASLYDASIGRADVEAQKAGGKLALERQLAAGTPAFDRPDGWNQHASPECVPLALAAAGKFDLPGAVDKLTMPLLVATGDCDPNLVSSRELVSLAPDARLVVHENVGHGSVLQRPDLAASTFLAFQAEIASRNSHA